MLFTKAFVVAAAALSAAAHPLSTTSNDGALTKRATESVHLVYCGSPDYKASRLVVYCSDDSNCNHQPASDSVAFFDTIYGPTTPWEGAPRSVTFTTGVTFTWTIRADAQALPNYSAVGDGSNGFKSFAIYKDDGHDMFVNGPVGQCRSIYYSLPISEVWAIQYGLFHSQKSLCYVSQDGEIS